MKILEDNWKKIYDEYLNIAHHKYKITKTSALYPNLAEGNYYNIGLYMDDSLNEYLTEEQKIKVEHAMKLGDSCPFTKKLIKTEIPNHGVAAFATLSPGASLNNHFHEVATNRIHLGLKVPKGDLGLMVRIDEIDVKKYYWEEGKTFTFDTGRYHQVWNNTNEERVILMVDI
jgi:aspartyl/asparaginyl beta-hydroxylase (cupin superfamily)